VSKRQQWLCAWRDRSTASWDLLWSQNVRKWYGGHYCERKERRNAFEYTGFSLIWNADENKLHIARKNQLIKVIMAVLQNCGKHVSWARHSLRSLWSTLSPSRQGRYRIGYLMGCTSVQPGRCSPTFRRKILPPSSGKKSMRNELVAWVLLVDWSVVQHRMEAMRSSETSVNFHKSNGVIRACSNCMSVYVVCPKRNRTSFLKHLLISLQLNNVVSFKALPSTLYTPLPTFFFSVLERALRDSA
jgi:hypothetical protein